MPPFDLIERAGEGGGRPCGLFAFYYVGGDKTIDQADCPPGKGCRRPNIGVNCYPCTAHRIC